MIRPDGSDKPIAKVSQYFIGMHRQVTTYKRLHTNRLYAKYYTQSLHTNRLHTRRLHALDHALATTHTGRTSEQPLHQPTADQLTAQPTTHQHPHRLYKADSRPALYTRVTTHQPTTQ